MTEYVTGKLAQKITLTLPLRLPGAASYVVAMFNSLNSIILFKVKWAFSALWFSESPDKTCNVILTFDYNKKCFNGC